MPIKAKEFAVNKLINYDLPNGFIVDDSNQIVGSVEGYMMQLQETAGLRLILTQITALPMSLASRNSLMRMFSDLIHTISIQAQT